ncbi:uncharacterized protein LOC123222656 isoform X2 [Mangifera indica]|nr:uncharacterized protein LOC123222656 isoform X2 [Mangifera indica]
MQSNSSNGSLKKKGKHVVGISVRRSVRLQGTAVHTHNQDIERLIDEVTLTESEKEDEPSTDEMEQPKPTMENKNLEDKVDYLIQLVESQQSKFSPHENLCMCHARYKNLYFDSQKKIETLTNENHQLALKLENALGKLESTENHTRSYSELLEKWKDVIFASNLTKAVESISSQAGHAQDAGREAKTPLAKRKKFDK